MNDLSNTKAISGFMNPWSVYIKLHTYVSDLVQRGFVAYKTMEPVSLN